MVDVPSHDLTGEALFHLLYGRASRGYAVLNVRRSSGNGWHWERHGIDITDPALWVLAIETAVAKGIHMQIWPFACGRRVMRDVGTSAFNPSIGSNLRAWQATVALRWETGPVDEAMARFVGVGGHVIANGTESYGLLPLDEARPLGALTRLTKEVGAELGAEPLGYTRALPVPGVADAAFVTDPALALTQVPVSGDDIARAGLRTQRVPGVTPEGAA